MTKARKSTKCCGKCKHYQESVSAENNGLYELGLCRALPPHPKHGFPQVKAGSLCGFYDKKKTKTKPR